MSIRFVSGQVKWKSLPAGWQIIRPPHEVSALALLDDTVWAAGRDGLHRIDRTSGQLLPSPEGTPRLRYVRDLLVDGEGRLWIAHGGGVMIHTLDLWQPLAAEAGAKARSLLEDEQGRLWFGSEYNGLAIRDAKAWRYLGRGRPGRCGGQGYSRRSRGRILAGHSAEQRPDLVNASVSNVAHPWKKRQRRNTVLAAAPRCPRMPNSASSVAPR